MVGALPTLIFPEFKSLAPNHLRVRIGVGNRVFFNQIQWIEKGARTVARLEDAGLLTLSSSVVDIGSGAGRLAWTLRRLGFDGKYVGIDVDREMVEWCSKAFQPPNFQFVHVDMASRVYNPNGKAVSVDWLDRFDDVDLVLGESLFTHLLEPQIRDYLAVAARMLKPGGAVEMSVFCLEHLKQMGELGGRWTFPHEIGPARVESLKYPEAAVAYTEEWLLDAATAAGLVDAVVVLPPWDAQSYLRAWKNADHL